MSLSSNFPTSKPSLNLDFANVGALDPRITFTRSSSATYTNSLGLITTAATNVARFDYDPVTLAARGLLVEEQRTNLLTYSSAFTNAAWSKYNLTVTDNAVTAPDGQTSASSCLETTDNSVHIVVSGIISSGTYTVSAFVKPINRQYISIKFAAGGAAPDGWVSALFNTTAKTAAITVGSAGGFTSNSATVQDYGNGWLRLILTSTASTSFDVGIQTSDSASPTYGFYGNISFAGNTSNGFYLWGAQLEAGSFATSYIPTVASTVTRSADVASVNTLSPWWNGTEGTLFGEATAFGNGIRGVLGINSSSANSMAIYFTDPSVSGEITVGSVTQFYQNPTRASKFALAFKANDSVFAAGGSVGTTDTSVTLPTATVLDLGIFWGNTSYRLNGHLQRVAFYPRRLSSAELSALTA